MIVNYYIAVENEEARGDLEKVLSAAKFPFYDATHHDPYTGSAEARKRYQQLEYIEADLDLK